MPHTATAHIRPYRPDDRPAVRALCCDTGFLGQPIDPIFQDRELFADYLTSYYTDIEPESAFVLTIGDNLRGYLLGARRTTRQQIYNLTHHLRLLWRGATRYPGYNPASRKFIHWILTTAWRETPAAPSHTPHFHINILPDARALANSRALLHAYLTHLRAHNEARVFGQMVTYENRRGEQMFARFGFRVLNKSEITKYRHLTPQRIYLTTVLRDLQPTAAAQNGNP